MKDLAKRYRSVEDDIGRELRQLDEQGPDPRDDEVRGFAGVVFKRRVRNSDNNKGKSGGYRLVYAVLPEGIAVLTVFCKSDQSDMPAGEISAALAAMAETLARIDEDPEQAAEILARHRSD